MSFTAGHYYVFLCAVVVSFYALPGLRARKLLLLGASIAFYLQFPFYFTALLGASLLADFFLAQWVARGAGRKALVLSLLMNFIPLIVFKWVALRQHLTLGDLLRADDITLPLGLSFYTFKSVSYILDVHRKLISPTESLLDYALFVSFFPTLLAGPVSRWNEFPLDDLKGPPRWSNFEDGLGHIIVGLAKKVLIADQLHRLTLPLWNRSDLGVIGVLALMLATYVKLYADFSGYTDIARGSARLVNLQLPENFRLPFFATTPPEFWRRQHITMSQWFRDYIYLPIAIRLRRTPLLAGLGGIWLTLFLSGIWHGLSSGALAFFVVQGVANTAFFLLRRAKMDLQGSALGWILTQLTCMFSIFCLLSPSATALRTVLQSMDKTPTTALDFTYAHLTLGFLVAHALSAGPRVEFLQRLRPAALAVMLGIVVLLSAKNHSFIYYQF